MSLLLSPAMLPGSLQESDITEQDTVHMDTLPALVFTCRSFDVEAVKACLLERGLYDPHDEQCTLTVEWSFLCITYPTDAQYMELVSWSSDAFGCGLITQPHIERS